MSGQTAALSPRPPMDAIYCNAFITSLRDTFQSMFDCPVCRVAVEIGDVRYRDFDVSGVIGVSGEAVGTIVVSFSEEVALRAASQLLLSAHSQLNDEVVDALGELTNMVVGPAKAALPHFGLRLSLPTVVTGIGHHVNFPSNVMPITFLFQSPWGPLALTIGMTYAGESTRNAAT